MKRTSEQLNVLLARLLVGWIWGSLSLLTAGLILAVREDPRYIRRMILLPPATLFSHLKDLHPEALVNLGLLLIVLTPIARVVTLAVYFLTGRERMYGLLSLITLFLLLSDLFAALR